ncbi:MAG: hypothetical protein F6K42_16750 [Leptolyngbya sp. SIO1D8]|nr:hypothetical protein [Leptolyngbya sp. SIO1D8]
MRQNEHEFDELEALREEVKSLKSRYEKLKGTYDRVSGGVIAITFLITGYLGYTTFFQVPSVVRSVVPNAVSKSVPEAVNNILPDALIAI